MYPLAAAVLPQLTKMKYHRSSHESIRLNYAVWELSSVTRRVRSIIQGVVG